MLHKLDFSVVKRIKVGLLMAYFAINIDFTLQQTIQNEKSII